jgi:hypothetical protein
VALLVGREAASSYAPVPYFWSDQYDAKIQFVGRSGDMVEVVHGSVQERAFVALYGRSGILVGALTMNLPRQMVAYRQLIAERASFERALAHARR